VSRHAGWVAVTALGLALYLPALGVEILRHPLEAKYALAAREMLGGGPLLVAHLFGEIYPDKPPLHFWVTAALGWLGGGTITEVTARLPAVLAAVAALLLTGRLGADLFGPSVGLLSAAVLATSNLFFWYARQGHPDQLMTAAVTLAALAWWRSRDPERSRTRWLVVAYASMALGTMSKGLVALCIPLLAAAAYLVSTGPLRALPGGLGLLPGLPVFLLVVGAWYVPAVLTEGLGYAYETVVHQQVVRYTGSWVHRGPWYYYIGEFTAGFFPWVLFLPGAVALARRARETSFLYPLGWLVTGFLFFSLASSKRGAYLLPVYPAAAILVGWVWTRAVGSRERTPWIGVPLALVSVAGAVLAAGLAGLALGVVPRGLIPGTMVDTLVPSDPRLALIGALVLTAGASLAWLPWQAGRPPVAVGALLGLQIIVLLAVATIRAPQYEARFPVRAFATLVRAAVPPGTPILSLLGDYDFIVAFYAERPFAPRPGPSELLAERVPGQARYALVDGRQAEVLAEPGVTRLAETRLGPKPVALVRLEPRPR
jgi:4-amino-4-deoxy-L-arabinose transferase-like glycosyltransferase